MSKVDPPPDEKTIQERRRPKFVIDPKDVSKTDGERVRDWMLETIKKYESKLDLKKWKHLDIVAANQVEAEAIDVRNIYPFADLHWVIFREGNCFSIMLVGNRVMLCKSSYLKT